MVEIEYVVQKVCLCQLNTDFVSKKAFLLKLGHLNGHDSSLVTAGFAGNASMWADFVASRTKLGIVIPRELC